MKWLGLRPSQAQMLNIHATSRDPLTIVDVSKIDNMLDHYSENKIPESYRKELLLMKSMDCKIELEALYSKGITFAADFFRNALKNKDNI